MTVTAILTTKAATLTIATMQDVLLEKKDDEAPPQKLGTGIHTDIQISSGVFRMVSKQGVRVTAPASDIHVVTFDKQGGPIEFAKILPPGFTGEDVIDFLGLKSEDFQ